ncbi:helix-turn-helix transcriptional regulator [Streptomyces longwoodensis]|uniref:AraC family transcriptional regulator n=1 Tax=Streptomyces longwoodensis TaxID=68231 RepID=UPI00340799FA
MPVRRHPSETAPTTSTVWPSGGRHLWSSGRAGPLHAHARGHLVYAATGVLTVRTEGGTSVVPANRIAWTPAGRAHQHLAHGDTDMRIVFLPPSLAGRVPDRPAVFLASGLAREVLLALTGPDGNGHPAPAHGRASRARLLRVLVDELRETREQPLRLPEPRDDRLRSLARILSEDPAANAPLAELGRAVGAGSRTLSRLLREELGMTFYEWRTQLRVQHALVLLADGHGTTRTAHACGWANASSFIAAFAQVVGTTPGRYRAAAAGRDAVSRPARRQP